MAFSHKTKHLLKLLVRLAKVSVVLMFYISYNF